MQLTCVRAALLAAGPAAFVASGAARAAEQTLTLDPAATSIEFGLGATLHRVEGALRLSGGEIRFDSDTGAAAGEIAIDARSASTGLGPRDDGMHEDVLESERHPRIVFRAERLRVVRRDATRADVELAGVLEMHGERHPFSLPARLEARGHGVAIETGFRVPYVEWGMRDPSGLILRVDRFVDVRVRSEGRIAAASAPEGGPEAPRGVPQEGLP